MEMKCVLKVTVDNPNLGDMYLDATRDVVFTSTLAEEAAQLLTVAFNFFKGEWFLGLDEGTPWYDSILVKNPADRIIRSVFTQIITSCEPVDSLISLSYTVSRDRQLSAVFKARLKDGSTFNSNSYGPYVVAI